MTTETKPKLAVKRVSYLQVNYRDIGKFIQEVYGVHYYNPVATEEWNNDSSRQITVKKQKLDKWDLETLEKVKAGKEPSYSFRAVMTDLCNRDLIEPGDYLIDVCW